MGAVTFEVACRIKNFMPRNISSIVWSFTTLSVWKQQILGAFATATIAETDRYTNSQDLCNDVWRLATVGHYGNIAMVVAIEHGMVVVDDLKPQDPGNCKWVPGTLGVLRKLFMGKAGCGKPRCVFGDPSIAPQNLTNIT
eukprot:gnl/MRDRNA2_/MRDRNA2_86654_c0_seq1.p1 gnl/MRDRNA2_/MRDRNA2_86654_c0~~gnl/MRDRNA2_/MRDRNA2_86654_c0_seq1.p1  ORF type:complete len:140 (+),score=17.34 gnl/MRDRNA2_/MRDRNA2_86654_c0_seq1:188-607(+)